MRNGRHSAVQCLSDDHESYNQISTIQIFLQLIQHLLNEFNCGFKKIITVRGTAFETILRRRFSNLILGDDNKKKKLNF